MSLNLSSKPHSPSSSTNPNLPHSSPNLLPPSSPNLPPSSSNGYQTPPNLKIEHRAPKKKEALTNANPLSLCTKPNKEKAEAPHPPCGECSKKFPSLKALFGHMRCHPERNCRVVNPPPSRHDQVERPVMKPKFITDLPKFSFYEIQAAWNLALMSREAFEKAKAKGSSSSGIKKDDSSKKRKDELEPEKVELVGIKNQKSEENIVDGGSLTVEKKVFGFDLNLPPPVEKEEGDSGDNTNPNPEVL